ncbi:hypothetical protein Slala04_36650 [Streptomyces lavendulae subsp. lavendulae]|nr:hypothetical protein Slala04_36650 [Streptomyces lavendulae subsp. lavendulae]
MANPVIDGKRADSARRRERVLKAIDAAVKSGGDITISGLAPHGSSRPDIPLYRHPNLLERVHVAASAPTGDGWMAAVCRTSKPTSRTRWRPTSALPQGSGS